MRRQQKVLVVPRHLVKLDASGSNPLPSEKRVVMGAFRPLARAEQRYVAGVGSYGSVCQRGFGGESGTLTQSARQAPPHPAEKTVDAPPKPIGHMPAHRAQTVNEIINLFFALSM